MNFQDLIKKLDEFWSKQGCVIGQPYGVEVGAGTGNPNTAFRVLGPEPFNVAYVEPSRRPTDGRYGENPNRFQHYFQYQIILKPAPVSNQELYMQMLKEIGFDPKKFDIRFVEDNWESTPIGAWGLGWEVWADGMEISQYTYFQQMLGINLDVPALEITLGLERLAMYIQDVDDYRQLKWNDETLYSDMFQKHEYWQSKYNYETSNIDLLKQQYALIEKQITDQLGKNNYWATYDLLLKLSHTFNLLDAQGVISLSDRTEKFVFMQRASKTIGEMYLQERKDMKYPLQNRIKPVIYAIPESKISYDTTKKQDQSKYILELGFEEIPAKYLIKWEKQIPSNWLENKLKEEDIEFDKATINLGPRRIVFEIDNIKDEITKDLEIKGPPTKIAYSQGKPTQALFGFLKKNQANEQDIEIKNINNDEYVFIKKTDKKQLKEIIQKIVDTLIKESPKQKFMRWDNNPKNVFIRPIRWIVSFNDEKLVDLELFDIKASNFTYTPRYNEQEIIRVNSAQDYLGFIDHFNIEIDHNTRRQRIIDAQKEKGSEQESQNIQNMINENTFLVESTYPTFAQLDAKYSKLPRELITDILEIHQRYLVSYDQKTNSICYGIVINGLKDESLVLEGNKKAFVARLEDGLFYYDQDQKIKLEDLREKLKGLNFHNKAGNYFEKTQRVKELVNYIYTKYENKEISKELRKALELIKNDKATKLAIEFPQLEGFIGKNYAECQGYDKNVADLLLSYYLPTSETSGLPESREAQILSIADKIDTLVNLSAVEGFPEKNDPYEIRKIMYNLIRLLSDGEIDLDITDIIKFAYDKAKNPVANIDDITEKFISFMNTRFYQYVKNNDENDRIVLSVINAKSNNIHHKSLILKDIKDLLKNKGQSDTVFDLIKRVNNILEKIDNKESSSQINEELIQVDIEKKLINFIKERKDSQFEVKDLLELSELLEKFFNECMVMDKNEQIRKNRISILVSVKNIIDEIYKYEK
ncbi:glycine--tRNA ligase subunit alpha [Candidatus Dojkabacteria bacterium]|nr:glycine--tRNA ligase subunit alpha [Candidatus Dojkabacteria bacterium]